MKKAHANFTANARFAFHLVFWFPLRPLCLRGEIQSDLMERFIGQEMPNPSIMVAWPAGQCRRAPWICRNSH